MPSPIWECRSNPLPPVECALSERPYVGGNSGNVRPGSSDGETGGTRYVGKIWQRIDNPAMTNASSSSRADRLHATLTQAFSPAVLQVQDDSAHHAGHSGAPAGGQSHYTVLLVSNAFQGVSRVARSRAVHSALAAEFGPAEQGGMHALALILRTPEEHAAQAGR